MQVDMKRVSLLLLLCCGSTVLPQTIFDCPEDWVVNNNVCYKFVFDPKGTYEKAQETCASMGTGLLQIKSSVEHNFIDSWLQSNDYYRNTWYTSGIRDLKNPNTYAWDGDFENNIISQDQRYWLANDRSHLNKQGEIIAYSFDGLMYGWTLVNRLDPYSFICEISQSEAYRLTQEKRDFDYGVPYTEVDKIPRGPSFKSQPEDLTVVSRALIAILECRADANPLPEYKWKRSRTTDITEMQTIRETITSELDSRYTLTNGKLSIQDPSEVRDAGTYQCFVENDVGTILSNPVLLSFGFLGEFSNVRDNAVNALAYEGAVVQCSNIAFKPAVLYNWQKGVGDRIEYIYTETTPYIFISSNGRLYFSEVTSVDENDYYCQVTLTSLTGTALGTTQAPSKTSLAIKMNILSQAAKTDWGPKIQDDFIAVFPTPPLKGQNVRMECFAYGSANNYEEMWRYSWQREGKPMPENAEFSDFNRVMTIHNARLQDQGIYTCLVKRGNKASDRKSVYLNLEAEPYFIIQLQNQHVDKGSQLSWRCEANGYPSPTYRWFKNGVQLSTIDGDIQVNGNLLIIQTLDVKHEGMYQCAATNVHGTTMSEAQLRVLYFEPSFMKFPLLEYMVGALGGEITIVCQPEAAPSPQISWSKNNIGMSFNDRVRLLSNNNLRITELSYSDAGFYTCTADNGVGNAASSTGRLEVKTATIITIGPQSDEVVVNQTAFFACQASYDRNLDLVYVWKLNGKILDLSKDFHYRFEKTAASTGLYVLKTQFKHAGIYECIAKTTLNQASQRASLIVLGPPGEPAGLFAEPGSMTKNSMRLNFFAGTSHGSPILYFIVRKEIEHYAGWKIVNENFPASLTPAVGQKNAEMRRIIISNLLPGNGYRFQIAAVNKYGVGDWSQPSKFYETLDAPPDMPVQYVYGGNGSVGDLTIKWRKMVPEYHGGRGFGYIVYWRKHRENSLSEEVWVKVMIPEWTVDEYVQLVGEENYYLPYEIKMQTYNYLGKGPNSTVVLVYSAEGMPLGTPQNLFCDAYNATAMLVTWEEVPDTRETMKGRVRGYQINYWLDGDEEPIYKQYIRFRGQLTEGVVIGLFPDTNFWFEVQVFNTAGLGPLSTPFIQETLHEAPKLYPQEVHVYGQSSTSVMLTWRGVSTFREEQSLDGYKIYLWPANEHYRTATVYETEKFQVEYVIYGIQKGKVYAVRVAGYSAGGEGRKSPTVYFTLGGQIPLDNATTSLKFEGIDNASSQSSSSITFLFLLCLFTISLKIFM